MILKGIYTINEQPKVIGFYGDEASNYLKKGYEKPDGSPLYCLIHLTFNHGLLHRMLRKKWLFHQLKRKGITPLMATNSKQEEWYRKLMGIEGLQCITYIYIDEYHYKPLQLNKEYDAVYAAQLIGFKRIELIQEIEKVNVLTYVDGATQWDLHQKYPNLTHVQSNSKWVNTTDKNILFNKSKVGLALSKEEGAMMASVEYMLSGLPVVSTKSKGGRDEYYDDEYCLIVKDTPRAVKEGVQEMIQRNLDPAYIRQKTMEKIDRDRNRYVDYICEYVKKHSGEKLNPTLIKQSFFLDTKANLTYLSEIKNSDFLSSFLNTTRNQKVEI